MALASNSFDLLSEESHARNLLGIVGDPEAKAAFKAQEAKKRAEAKDAAKKAKEAARKKKENERKAKERRKEQEANASMARRMENRRRWFESDEQKKWEMEESQRREENQRRQALEDAKLREDNPEKWEAEMKRREKESLIAAVFGLLRQPPRFSSSPSHEFQKRGPVSKQGQVQGGVKTKQQSPKTPSIISDSSDIGSVSGFSGSTTTTTSRPSTLENGTAVKPTANLNGSVKAVVTSPISSCLQIEEGKREKAKDTGIDGAEWQVVPPRRRKQGSDRSSNPDDQTQTINVVVELKKEESLVNKVIQKPQVYGGLSNGGRRVNNNGGRRVNNAGQRFKSSNKEVKFEFDNAAEFPTLGRK